MRSEKVRFEGASGAHLAARLDLPEGPVRAAAIFAHCFTCSKDIPAARRIAGRLAARGLTPQLLVGHSLGGAAVIRAAARLPGVRAVATIGAPSDPSHVAHTFGGKLDEIRQHGAAQVTLAGRSFEIRRQFLDDIAGATPTTARSAILARQRSMCFAARSTCTAI